MRYCTWADVTARYPNIAKAGQAEATAIDAGYINGAEAELDSRLAGQYTVPFVTTPTLAPPIIKDVATDMAYYRIALFRLTDAQATQLKGFIDSRIKGLIQGDMLILTGSGTVVLGAGPSRVWGTHQNYPNVTGVDSFSNFQVSYDETTDANDSRDPSVYGFPP
jgi:phage gp36-like protein